MKYNLGKIKREICEHLDGKFEFLTVHKATVIPDENAISLIKEYEFSWRRTAEKWGSFALDQIHKEYPDAELLRVREIEPKEWLDKKQFEAVIRF